MLVEKNATVDMADQHGMTPLMWALLNGFLDIAKYLVQNSADVDKTEL